MSVIDHVFGSPGGESFHEVMKESYLSQSDIPETLTIHGYGWRDFLDDTQYPILEQPAPALCADRVGYFFRDSLALGILTHENMRYILSHLTIRQQQIVVDQISAVQMLAYNYMEADEKSWSNLQAVELYEMMAGVIRRAIKVNAISEKDVWQTDLLLWEKLGASNATSLQWQLERLSGQICFEENRENPLFEITPKIRTIDPLVSNSNIVIPLSKLDPVYCQRREEYLISKQRKLALRLSEC